MSLAADLPRGIYARRDRLPAARSDQNDKITFRTCESAVSSTAQRRHSERAIDSQATILVDAAINDLRTSACNIGGGIDGHGPAASSRSTGTHQRHQGIPVHDRDVAMDLTLRESFIFELAWTWRSTVASQWPRNADRGNGVLGGPSGTDASPRRNNSRRSREYCRFQQRSRPAPRRRSGVRGTWLAQAESLASDLDGERAQFRHVERRRQRRPTRSAERQLLDGSVRRAVPHRSRSDGDCRASAAALHEDQSRRRAR